MLKKDTPGEKWLLLLARNSSQGDLLFIIRHLPHLIAFQRLPFFSTNCKRT